MKRFPTPDRAAAALAAADIVAGSAAREVRMFAEPLDRYGPGRNPFTVPVRVLGLDFLPGSSVPTGRVLVDLSLTVSYQKTATRGGTREYRAAPARTRAIVVWPWDLELVAASSRDADRTE
jgi:hypothetical protein